MRESFIRHWAMNFFPSLRPGHALYAWIVLLTVMLSTFMVVLDGTIVNVAIATIMASFGITISQVVWISTAYLIALSIFLAVAGWISEHFGKKRTYIFGLFLFTLSSYLCGIAWNLHALVFFRVIQGIGGGILLPVGMHIFTTEFPPEKRTVALGFYSISAAAAISLGPSVGGYLIEKINWGWIFFINVPLGIVVCAASILILKTNPGKKIAAFDGWGFLFLTVFLVALISAISSGNAPWNAEGWLSTYTLGCFALSLCMLMAFIYQELTTPFPIVEIKVFKNWNFLLGNIALFVFSFTLFGSSFLLPLYFQNGLEYSTLQTGLMLLPMGLAQGFFSGFTGLFIKKIPARFLVFLGIVLLGLSYQFNSHFTLYTEKSVMIGIFILRGFAMALVFAPLVSLTLSTITEEKLAQATGIFSVQRQIGALLGVAVFETIFTNRQIYHSAIYGSVIHDESPLFTLVKNRVETVAQSRLGSSFGESMLQAQQVILEVVDKHIFVQSITDNLLIAGWVTFFSCLPLFFLRKARPRSF